MCIMTYRVRQDGDTALGLAVANGHSALADRLRAAQAAGAGPR